MPTQVATTLLRYDTDLQSAQQTIRVNQDIADALDSTASASSGAAVSYGSIADAAQQLGLSADQVAQLTGNTQDLATAAQQAADAQEQLAKSSADASAAGGGGDGGGDGGGFSLSRGDVRGLRYGLSAIPGASSVTGPLSAAAYLGPAGLAVGGFSVALQALIKNADDGAKVITQDAQAYEQAALDSASATTAELKAKRDAADIQVQIAQSTYDQLNAQLQKAQMNVVPIAALLGTDATYKGLEQSVDAANTKLQQSEADLNALNLVLDSSNTKTNDYNSVLTALSKDGLAIATAATQQLTHDEQLRAQEEVQAESMTAAQRKDAINSMYAEMSALQDYKDENTLTAAELIAVNKQIADLNTQTDELSKVNFSYADSLAQVKAATDANSAQLSNITAYVNASQQVYTTNQQLIQDQQAAADAIAQIESDEADKELSQRQETAQKLIEIDQQTNEKILESHEQTTLSVKEDIAKGDQAAAQAALARQQVSDQDARRQESQQDQQAQQQLQTELQQDRTAEAQQLASQQRTNAAKLAADQLAYQQALVNQQNANAAMLSQEQAAAFNAQYYANQTQQAWTNLGAAISADATSILNAAQAALAQQQQENNVYSGRLGNYESNQGSANEAGGLQQIQQELARQGFITDSNGNIIGLPGDVSGSLSGLYQGYYNNSNGYGGFGIGSFASGIDYVPKTMLAVLHPGERVLTAQQNKGGAGGMNLTINVPGAVDASAFVQIARDQIAPVLQRMSRAQFGA